MSSYGSPYYNTTADQQQGKYTTTATNGDSFAASFSKPYTPASYSTNGYSYTTPSTQTTNTTSYSYTTPSTNGYSYTTPSTNSYSSYTVPTTKPTTTNTTTNGYSSYTLPSTNGYSYNLPSTNGTYGTSTYGGASNYSTPSYLNNYGTSSYGTSTYGAPTSNYSSYTSYTSPYSTTVTQPTSYTIPTVTPTTNVYNNIGSQGTQKPAPKISEKDFGDISKAGKQLFAQAFGKTATDSSYADLIKQLQASGQKYRDLDFPPELRSLTGGMSDYELQENYIQVDMKKIVWLRAEEIYGKGNYKLFQDSIEPNDIRQGALGDCYFLSTLAAIAENPKRIRNLFQHVHAAGHHAAHELGCYAVNICDMGIWTTVILDDYIPCSAKSKKPIFTDAHGSELWVALLEKAWAKVYGSYARIDAGLTRECLHDLTGAPTKFYLTGDSRKNEEIWTAISDGEKKNFVMTCGSGDLMDGADLMSSVGLVGSHAYSLLAALTVKDKYGKDVRLVKIRNPWGQGEWKGAWSDNSASWTPELRAQLKVENSDDGIFYMSYDDMLKYYTDIQICKVHDDFYYKSLKSSCNHVHAAFFKITVKTAGHYYITINQESTRKHAERENYRYSKVRLVFGKKVGDGYQYVEGITNANKEVWTDGHLDAGEYYVYAKIAWNEQKTKEFSISSYGAGDVEIEKVDESQCRGLIEKVYTSKGRTIKLENYAKDGVNNCYRGMELTDDGFGFIYYKNESNKTLEEDFYFKVMSGFKLKKPYKGSNFKISVPPGQERVVILKQLPNANGMSHNASAVSRFV